MPASGHQNHTTSPSASAPLVLRRRRVHRIPHPTFVTTAKRPSCEGGTVESIKLFLANGEAKYFSLRDWTAVSFDGPSGKSPHELASATALSHAIRAQRPLPCQARHLKNVRPTSSSACPIRTHGTTPRDESRSLRTSVLRHGLTFEAPVVHLDFRKLCLLRAFCEQRHGTHL